MKVLIACEHSGVVRDAFIAMAEQWGSEYAQIPQMELAFVAGVQ